MTELLLVLFPILVADVINPVLFAGVVFALGSQKPVVNTLGLIGSFGLSYFASGVFVALLFESFQLPEISQYYLELIIAALLFIFAWFLYKDDEELREKRLKTTSDMGFWDAILLGLQVNLVGLPFALPYFAAIDQILIAQISYTATISILLLYNLIYILPFLIMVCIRWVFQEESTPIFEKTNEWIHYISAKYLPLIFVLIGLYLVIESFLHLL